MKIKIKNQLDSMVKFKFLLLLMNFLNWHLIILFIIKAKSKPGEFSHIQYDV